MRMRGHAPTVARGTAGSPLPPFPIFVGRGRSGTTLFRAIFDSHPELAIPASNKAHFLVPMAKARARYEHRDGFAVEPFLREVFAQPRFEAWGVPEGDVRAAFDERPPEDYPGAIRTLYRAYAHHRGKPRYGDKIPDYVVHIGSLSKLLPETRFVHVIRDGRDSSLSYMEIDFGPDRLDDAAVYWRRFVRLGRRAGRRLGPSRYREVRYEDLLDDPETVVRSLCAFLELDFDPGMLRYYERAEQIVGGVGHHTNVYRPPTRGLRDWRSQMSHDEVVLFESLAGDLLEELGYERRVRRLPLAARLRARWHWMRTRAPRAVKRLMRAAAILRGRR